MKRVLLCGPFPTPVGGVSIHLQRLQQLLIKNGVDVIVCDESSEIKSEPFSIRSLNFLRYASHVWRADVVHVHSSLAIFRIIHLIAAFALRKKVIVTIHSWREGPFLTSCWTLILNLFSDHVIFVSAGVRDKFPGIDVPVHVFPAFIPPFSDGDPLPQEVVDFIGRARAAGKSVGASNAFRLVPMGGGDMYGLDICLEAFKSDSVRANSVLIFSVSDADFDVDRFEKFSKDAGELPLSESFLLYKGALNFWALLKECDFSVRATSTDGDALSVRESIYLNRPCVASDAVERPSGVVLFKSRSSDDLARKIEMVTSTGRGLEGDVADSDGISDFYLGLY